MNLSIRLRFREKSNRLVLTIAWFAILSLPVAAVAQFEEVITHESGIQFEGRYVPIQQYSESLGDSFADGSKPILMLDDGMRRVFFPTRRVINKAPSDRNETSMDIFQRTWAGNSNGYGLLIGMTPFDENGHRTLRVQTVSDGVREYTQGITRIGPRFCELETLTIPGDKNLARWDMRIPTDSIPVELLVKLMRKQIRNNNRPSEFLKIVDILVQAKKIDRAIRELRYIQDRFPNQFDELEKDRKSLRQLFARVVVLEEIKQRMRVGQTEIADSLASVFVDNDVAQTIVQEVATLRAEIAQQNQNIDNIRQAVLQLVAKIRTSGKLDAKQTELVNRFADEIESELSLATVDRLDTFLRFANDTTTPDMQKLALAISSWLVGSNTTLSGLDNFAIVESMYPVRDLAREYLTTDNESRRQDILKELEAFEAGQPAYLTEIIKSMKPTHPPENLAAYTSEKPIEFFVTVPGSQFSPEPKKFRCLAHLPPQYDPYRKYPCIMTLRPGIDLEMQLNRWTGPFDPRLGMRVGRAIRNGYVVVAVDWKEPGQANYNYSLQEHAAVIGALKQSLQMFSIDSDRVFLSGHSTGATAAYDIAVAHPDHWAGVIAFGGLLDKYCFTYGRNRHVGLPIYSVVGQKDPVARVNKKTWNMWLSTLSFQDCILVEYRGRLNEPFMEELPEIFRWTAAYRRVLPDKTGFELDFKTLRPWDNYFWFWELHGFPENVMHRPEHWSEQHPRGAPKLTAEISSTQTNMIKNVGPKKLGQFGTIWLSPDFIDFNQEIQITGRGRTFKDFVKPSRKVILEDVRRRADRQHPFWARVDCEGGSWSVPE